MIDVVTAALGDVLTALESDLQRQVVQIWWAIPRPCGDRGTQLVV